MATINGFKLGEFYSPNAFAAAGYQAGVPRNWAQGGDMMYDPQFAKPQTAYGSSMGQPMARRFDARASYPGAKPSSGGGVRPGSAGYSEAMALRGGGLPWQTAAFGGGAGGGGNIATSIVPRPIYSEAMTRDATNLAVADHHKAGFLPDVLKRYDRSGISRGAGQTARALGDVAASNQAARRAAVELPMEDAFANTEAILQGQIGREGEAQALSRIMLKLLGNNQDLRFGLAGAQNDLLGSGMNLANSLFA